VESNETDIFRQKKKYSSVFRVQICVKYGSLGKPFLFTRISSLWETRGHLVVPSRIDKGMLFAFNLLATKLSSGGKSGERDAFLG
jgi:hypothetical protein